MMNNDVDGMQAVLDRLTRLEERGIARDERAGRMEASIAQLVVTVEALRDDVKAAKTGLRVGMAIMGALGTMAGWLLSHLPVMK